MRIGTTVTGLVMAILLQLTAEAAEEPRNTITVNGAAEVSCKPDVAYITLYVKGDGILMVDAAKAAKQKTDVIEKAIKEKHKEIKEIKVTEIEVGQRRREVWSPEQKDESPSPQVVKRMTITAPPETSVVYEVIDSAIRAGAVMTTPSSVEYPGEMNSVVVYGLLAASQLEGQARKNAVENARSNAEQMAKLIGKKIGGCVSIMCGGTPFWPQELRVMGHETSFPVKQISTDPDSIKISYSVTITYELVQ